MSSKQFRRLALLLTILVFALACRTAETIAELRPHPTNTRPRVTRTATRRVTRIGAIQPSQATPTAIVAITDIPEPPSEPPEPSEAPARATPRPTNRPAPRATARPPDTAVPQPTTPQFEYRIQESRCGPNVRTFIEGFVYDGGVGRNDVLVRISQGPDGQPDPNDDYRTGTDPRKGYYYHNIDANAPHDGTWYLWVIDPTTQQRISEIAIVKTDKERVEDSGNSAGSCQSATVIFGTGTFRPTTRPTTPAATEDPNATPGATPTPSPTQDGGNDS